MIFNDIDISFGNRCGDVEVVFDSNIATFSVFGVAAGDILRATALPMSAAVSVG